MFPLSSQKEGRLESTCFHQRSQRGDALLDDLDALLESTRIHSGPWNAVAIACWHVASITQVNQIA